MSLWYRLLNSIRKASQNSRSMEVQKAELSPVSPTAQLQPTTAPVVPLPADQLSTALEIWRQQHDFIQAEINEEWDRTQDQLYQRQHAYLRTLHPFLRYYVPLQNSGTIIKTDEFCVSGEEKRKLSLRYFVALDYFRYLLKQPTDDVIAYLNKSKAEMSHEDWALVERYRSDATQIVKKANAAREHYHRRIPENFRRKITQKVADAFWAQYGSPELKYQAAYELARHDKTDDLLPTPFRLLGYMGPDWDKGGMVFAIDRDCFADSDPLLCYWEEDEMPEIDWAQAQEEPYELAEDAYEYNQRVFEQFRYLSSGIVPLRIQGHFFFRLDERAVKSSFPHFGEDLPTAELSPYLFVKCGSRDFYAHFGQVVKGKIVQLYQRSI